MGTRKNAKRNTKYPFTLKVLLILCIVFVVITSFIKIIEFLTTPKPPDIPQLNLSLTNVTLEEIILGSKDTKYGGNQISFNTKNSSFLLNDVEIKGRGNHTWSLPKHPYQITLSSSTSLFNLPPARKWIFLADYLDSTHLRNNFALQLSSLLDSTFTPRGHYVELSIDNSYQGLYFVTEKIEVKKSRLHLKDPLGILVEIDDTYGSPTECLYDAKQNCIILKDAVNYDYAPTAHQNLVNSLNQLYSAISEKDYTTISNLIDVDSFARYYLINEFTNNPDAYSTSFFMYQDGLDDLIHAGPVWDFDIALGNDYWRINGVDTDVALSPVEDIPFKQFSIADNTDPEDPSSVATVVYDLLGLPEFRAHVKTLYQEFLSGKKAELLDYLQSQANFIRAAVQRDQARWKLNFNFDEEVTALLDWVAQRYNHFESTYGTFSQTNQTNQVDQTSQTDQTDQTNQVDQTAPSNQTIQTDQPDQADPSASDSASTPTPAPNPESPPPASE